MTTAAPTKHPHEPRQRVSRDDMSTITQAAALTLMRALDPSGDVSLIRVTYGKRGDAIWTTVAAHASVKEADGGPPKEARVSKSCIESMVARGWIEFAALDIVTVTDMAGPALRKYRKANLGEVA